MDAALEFPKSEVQAENMLELCTGLPERVELLDNYIIDTVDGYGIVIDSSTCQLEQNQLKKNAYGGLLITSTITMPVVDETAENRVVLAKRIE
jgi:hypothetical protein